MVYRLVITEHAEKLVDDLLYYLLFQLKSEQAATHLLDKIEKMYGRLENNPFQFPLCQDIYWAGRGFREAMISDMSYMIVFQIVDEIVNVMGVFHQLENYQNKL